MSGRHEPVGTERHVVVVGGGISGLAAAWFLQRASARPGGPDLRVTVLEGSPAVGGKLRVSDVGGVAVDEGAESLLLRRTEGTALVTAAGLGPDLVDAATSAASIWSRGRLAGDACRHGDGGADGPALARGQRPAHSVGARSDPAGPVAARDGHR